MKHTAFRLLKYTVPYLPYIILSLFFSVASAVFALMVPVSVGRAIDAAGGINPVESVLYRLALIAVFAALSAAAQWIGVYLGSVVTSRTIRDLRVGLFDSLCFAPFSRLFGLETGQVVNIACSDIDMISDGLLAASTQLFTGVATIAGTLVFMISVWPVIAAVVALLTPLSLILAAVIAKGSYKYFTGQTISQGKLSAAADEILSKPDLIKAYCYEKSAAERFDAENAVLLKCGFSAQFWSAMTNPSTRFVNSVIYTVTGIFSCIAAAGGVISVGQISTFLIYAGQYTKPFNEISGVVTQLQSALSSADRLFSIIDLPREDVLSGEEYPDSAAPDIEFRGVSFAYSAETSSAETSSAGTNSGGKKILDGYSLYIPAGQKAAVMGKTGCGKTTLCSLLLRFYDSFEGDILVGGKSVRTLSKRSLRSLFGVVPQDTWIFSGTIRENLLYGNPAAAQSEIEAAAKACQAHGFISRLAQGYDTVIGDECPLSFGQRQLLCIVRALLRNPAASILDEATSGVDVRTERLVAKAFHILMDGRTSIIIAHRPATARIADITVDMSAE